MFNRTDIPVTPSQWVGLLAALPWLMLLGFTLVLTYIYGTAFLILSALALSGAIYQWNLNGRLCLSQSVTRLIITESGLLVEQSGGDQFPATVDSDSRLYPSLAILKLRPSDATNKTCTVLLWASRQGNGNGNVTGDLHRQLRSWLHLGPAS